MEENESSTRRIAKNTIALYIRMFLSMIVGLYTLRVVLNTLGVEDYGIYGVVGGVVAMLGFLNASMSGATSRFITFELGRKDYVRLKDTFSSAMIIHIGIALVVLIVAETVGLWFLNNKLVIPPGRMDAAHWVYQCSILSAALGITQVPYNATIIAHERMGVYAYIEIINVTLKLLIVYLLTIGNFDKLKLYAVLVLVVSFIVMMIYRIYCIRNFSESRFHWIWNKEIIRPMLSFSGWDLYGNMCVTVRQQGTNFLINIFFGTVANVASTITTTINGLLTGLAFNIITAFRPGIIKSHSKSDVDRMQILTLNAIKFSSLFFLILSIPFYYETNYLINLWLGQVPEYVITFIHITLIANFTGLINSVITIGIHATGNIKYISIISGSMYLLCIPITLLLLKLNFPAHYAYIVNATSVIFILISNIIILKTQVTDFDISKIYRTIFKLLIVSLIAIFFVHIPYHYLSEGFARLTIISITSILIILILTYIIALTNSERQLIINYIKEKICRI